MIDARQTIPATACFLAIMTLPLAAQTAGPITQQGSYFSQMHEGSVAGQERLRVSAIGDISIRGANTNTVSYRVVLRVKAASEQAAQRYFKQAGPSASSANGIATLAIGEIDCTHCGFGAIVELTVPQATADAMVATRGGKLDIQGIEGRVNADTAGGTIALDHIGGDVVATTGGGNINLGTIGQGVRCETAGGSIWLASSGGNAVLNSSGGGIHVGRVAGYLRAETVGGSIRAEWVGGRVSAGTSGGTIQIGEAGGDVSVDTAGGSIEVANAPMGVHAETAAGDIRLTDIAGKIYAASASGNVHAYFISGPQLMDSMIEANAGSVILFLPVDMRVTVEAMVDFARNIRRIESEFPDIQVTRGDGFGGVQAIGQLNGGGPVLRVRNTTGRIIIRRRE
jgi:hypothetical protein